jgi:hypothetical protein
MSWFGADLLKVTEAYDTARPKFALGTSYLAYSLALSQTSPEDADQELRGDIARAHLDEITVLTLRTMVKIIKGWQDAAYISEHLRNNGQELTITLLQSLYREGERIRPRSRTNPFGENALVYKLNLLERLHSLYPNITARVLIVDDGCDGLGNELNKSGYVAQEIINTWNIQKERTVKAQVIHLAEAIKCSSSLVPRGLRSPLASIKGGAILYGLAYATQVWHVDTARHIIVDSDADLSIHPAQIASLVRPLIDNPQIVLAAGSRRELASVALIGKKRNSRGKLFIDSWRHLLPSLAPLISDTNRGFKAIDAGFVPTLLAKIEEHTFPYQIEMLLIAARAPMSQVHTVPIAYIDSEALSTQSSDALTQSYLTQIRAILAMARRHHEPYDVRFASLLDELGARHDAEELWATAEDHCQSVEELFTWYSQIPIISSLAL